MSAFKENYRSGRENSTEEMALAKTQDKVL